MSNANAAAIHIVFLIVDIELIATIDTLRSKCFVELPYINVVLFKTRILLQARNRKYRTNAHFIWLASGNRKASINTDWFYS